MELRQGQTGQNLIDWRKFFLLFENSKSSMTEWRFGSESSFGSISILFDFAFRFDVLLDVKVLVYIFEVFESKQSNTRNSTNSV